MRTQPLKHQQEFIDWLGARDAVPILLDRGLGKTWCAAYVIEKRGGPALWACRASFVGETALLIQEHSYLRTVELVGPLKQRLQLLAEDGDVFIVSYDALTGKRKRSGDQLVGDSVLLDAVKAKGFNAIVADESTRIKHYSARRTKTLLKLSKLIPVRVILTGQIITNSLFDPWSQYVFCDGGQTLGASFYNYRLTYFVPAGPTWAPKGGTARALAQLMGRTAFIRRKQDCIQLPPKRRRPVPCPLHPKARPYYEALRDEWLVELEDKTVVSVNYVIAKLTKLAQIVSGGLFDAEHILHRIPTNKLVMLHTLCGDILEDHQALVVWCRFKFEVEDAVAVLKRMRVRGVACYGEGDSSATVQTFQREKGCRAFVTTLAKSFDCVTLTKATAAIYYGRDYSVEKRVQSEDRIHRIGTGPVEAVEYFDIYAKGTIEEDMRTSVWRKRLTGSRIIQAAYLKQVLKKTS